MVVIESWILNIIKIFDNYLTQVILIVLLLLIKVKANTGRGEQTKKEIGIHEADRNTAKYEFDRIGAK